MSLSPAAAAARRDISCCSRLQLIPGPPCLATYSEETNSMQHTQKPGCCNLSPSSLYRGRCYCCGYCRWARQLGEYNPCPRSGAGGKYTFALCLSVSRPPVAQGRPLDGAHCGHQGLGTSCGVPWSSSSNMLLHWFVHTSRPVRRVRRVCLDWLSPVVSGQVTVTVGSQRMVTPWNPGTRVASGDPFGCRVPSVLGPGGSPEPTIRATSVGRLTRGAVCVHCTVFSHPPSAQRIKGNGCVLWA